MENQSDAAHEMEQLSMLYANTIFALRESRKHLLKRYEVAAEAELLEQIREGELASHPAYEHYLSALIVEQTRLMVRAQAAQHLGGGQAMDDTAVSVHLMLKDSIDEHYADRLAEPVRMAQDALLLSFDTELMIEVRYLSKDEYSIGWSWGEAELRIDTAPVHPQVASFPHHLHDHGGALRPDPVSFAGSDCWVNLSGLIDRLLVDPLLEAGNGVRQES